MRSPPPRRVPSVPQTRDAALTVAVAISLAMHVALGLILGRFVVGGAEGRASPFAGEPLRATLTSPAQRFAIPESAGSADAQLAPPAAGAAETGLPAPEKKERTRQPGGSGVYGQVIVNPLGQDEPVDPRMEHVITQIYPGAVRATPEFEKPPVAAYPDAALKDRRQVYIVVLVVVLEDGSVELAQGTYDDPLFGPSIKAALAHAKARPAIVDGEPRPIWTPMSFTFEVVGNP